MAQKMLVLSGELPRTRKALPLCPGLSAAVYTPVTWTPCCHTPWNQCQIWQRLCMPPSWHPCTHWPVKAFPTEVRHYTLEEVTVPSNVQTPKQGYKVHQTFLVTNLKGMESHEFPDQEFKVMILRKLTELQENKGR